MEWSERLSRYVKNRRRSGPPQRLLFLRQGQGPEEECHQAFRALGLTVQDFRVIGPLSPGPHSPLLSRIMEFLPDFLFCLNYTGVDPSGELTAFLTEARLPLATWYVNDPDFILRTRPQHLSEWLLACVWDKHYQEELEKMGVSGPVYLPLAADTRRFRPYRHLPLDRFGSVDAAFVGHSWVSRVRDHLAPYNHSPAFLAYIEAAACSFRWSADYRAEAVLAEVMPGFMELPVDDRRALEAAVIWLAAQQDRLERVSALIPAGLMVFGDAAWPDLIPEPLAYGGVLDYHQELPAFYQCVAVNLNFTGLMTKNGLNQRVFDVPAAGAFLLTDDKEALWELFAPDEVVTFSNAEEARQKLAYYLRYPETRRRLATRTRERVVGHHTYTHRLQVLLNHLSERFFS